MSRWIDADEVLKHKCDVYDINDHVLHAVPTGHILSAPSLDLVRCAECRYYRDYDGCFFSTAEVEPDGYCSYGERSEP